ncbi:MAG: small ribosomal subunit Rsm22 family protein [Nitrospirota bacterium]
MGRPRKIASPSAPASLADDVARLSRLLTRERDDLPPAYLRDQGLRRAYLAYFLPPNLAKIHVPLRELCLHPADLLKKDRLKVLDLGSGPGTSVLGIREFFRLRGSGQHLEFTAVDQVGENLKEAEALFREAGGGADDRATLTTVRSGIKAIADRSGGPFDIIVLSNVLNEIFLRETDRIRKRTELVRNIMARLLATNGSCIIIEPALQETSRDLLMVRDAIVDGGSQVYAPCLVQGRCPALVNPRDWCHEDRHWDPPGAVRELDEATGLRKDSLKFSYLILRKDSRSLADVCGPGCYRVVSEPLASKGKLEFYLCGQEGRRLATRLDKDASPANGAFERLQRGDVVRVEGLVVEERRFRITKESLVKPLDPFPRDRTQRSPLP